MNSADSFWIVRAVYFSQFSHILSFSQLKKNNVIVAASLD